MSQFQLRVHVLTVRGNHSIADESCYHRDLPYAVRNERTGYLVARLDCRMLAEDVLACIEGAADEQDGSTPGCGDTNHSL
jgi:hypothetical protein